MTGHDLYDLPNYHECEKVMMEGQADVECDKCGHCARIEPDGDYPCTACSNGRLVSPLVIAGLV